MTEISMTRALDIVRRWIPTVLASSVLVLALQVGASAATTGASRGGASEALQGKVRFQLEGKLIEPEVTRGQFTLSGAISDRGEFVERVARVRVNPGLGPPRFRFDRVRTFVGASGTIWTRTRGLGTAWEIANGSRAYDGIGGRGREMRHTELSRVDIVMRGTVF
jgi:hypothetical protein